MVHIGLERFVHHRQRDEIRAGLETDHGIGLSSGAISDLGRRFLVYLEALHREKARRSVLLWKPRGAGPCISTPPAKMDGGRCWWHSRAGAAGCWARG